MFQRRLLKFLFCWLILTKLWASPEIAHSFLLNLPGQEKVIGCFETLDGFIIFAQQIDTNKVLAIKTDRNFESQDICFLRQFSFTKINSIRKTNENGFILAGYEILYRQSKIKVVLLDEQLNVINEKTLPVSGADQWIECVMTLSDGYLLAGGHRTIKGNWYQALVVKLDENLETVWSKTFGGSSDEWFSNLYQLVDGYICVGSTESYGSGQADFLVVFLSKTGRLIWWKTFGGFGWERAVAAAQAEDGIIVAGSSNSFTAYNSIFLVKVNSQGRKIYQKTIDLGSDFTTKGIMRLNDKDLFIIFGEIWNGQFRKDLAYVIVNNHGEFIQKQIIQMNNDQYFSHIMPLSHNKFLIIASTENSHTSEDILLILVNQQFQ